MAAASGSEAIKQEINHFIETGINGNGGTTPEDKKKRKSLVEATIEAILDGILIRRSSGSVADEIQYIKDTLAGIGVSPDKIEQLYANNANPDTVVINVLQEFREEKKRKLDEEERKLQIAATDAENEKKAKDARDAARKKFFEDYRALSQEAAVIRQDISKGQNQLNVLQLKEDKIKASIACCEETIADLKAYIAEKEKQLEIKIREFESEIANFRVELGKHEKEEKESGDKLESTQNELEAILAKIVKLEATKERGINPADLSEVERKIKDKTAEKESKEAAIISLKEENDVFKKQVSASKALIDAKLADIQTEKQAFANIKSQVESVISDQEKTLAANQAELANNDIEKQKEQLKLADNRAQAAVIDEKIKTALEARKAEIEKLHQNDPEKAKLLAEVELAGLKEEFAKMKAELEVDANNLALQNAMVTEKKENIEKQKVLLSQEKNKLRIIPLEKQIKSGEKALAALQQKQQVLVQKIDAGKQALEAKEREIDGKRPGLPANSEFSTKDKSENSTINVVKPLLPDDKRIELKALETEAEKIQQEISEKQKQIDAKNEEIVKKMDEITALVGGGEEGPKTQEQQKEIEKLNGQLVVLQKEERELVKEKTPLMHRLAENTKKAEEIKEGSTTPTLVVNPVDSNKNPRTSIPTGTTSTGQPAQTTTTNTTSVSTPPSNSASTATNVSAAVLKPDDEEFTEMIDKLGLPPDLSGSDDAVKNFWLMLFALLTDVFAKGLAKDKLKKQLFALCKYAGAQAKYMLVDKDTAKSIEAKKSLKEAEKELKNVMGINDPKNPDAPLNKKQLLLAVVSIVPLLGPDTYVQRYGVTKSRANKEKEQRTENNSAELQTPPKNTNQQNNPTVTTNNNQNSASNSSMANTNTSTNPTVTANQSSGQTPTQNTANTSQMSNQSTNAPPPFIPQPPTVPQTILTQVGNTHATNQNDPNNALQQAIAPPPATSGEIVNKPTYNQPQVLLQVQEQLGALAQDGRNVLSDKANTDNGMFYSFEANDIKDMNELTKPVKQQEQEFTQKPTPKSDNDSPESGNNGGNNDENNGKRGMKK